MQHNKISRAFFHHMGRPSDFQCRAALTNMAIRYMWCNSAKNVRFAVYSPKWDYPGHQRMDFDLNWVWISEEGLWSHEERLYITNHWELFLRYHPLLHGGFLSHRGTPSHHPLINGFSRINPSFWFILGYHHNYGKPITRQLLGWPLLCDPSGHCSLRPVASKAGISSSRGIHDIFELIHEAPVGCQLV